MRTTSRRSAWLQQVPKGSDKTVRKVVNDSWTTPPAWCASSARRTLCARISARPASNRCLRFAWTSPARQPKTSWVQQAIIERGRRWIAPSLQPTPTQYAIFHTR
jgi:hypothetical protein